MISGLASTTLKSTLFSQPSRNFVFTYPSPRKLREIMKMSMIEREMPHVVASIWEQYHRERPQNVSRVVQKSDYSTIRKNSKESPMFLVPIKRKAGHLVLLGQNQGLSYMFTYLEDFKKNPATAHPYLILTMFDELLFTKGLVLVRGDIVNLTLTREESKFAMDETFRLMQDPTLYHELVYKFNHQPHEFDYEKFRAHYHL
mmetsp:Transcript_62950/g.73258  ORF Transcript_62950/g.73258 Transcript_62950/m.73258 type:complete len:201 (-) Transcript_62950:60-662(-)